MRDLRSPWAGTRIATFPCGATAAERVLFAGRTAVSGAGHTDKSRSLDASGQRSTRPAAIAPSAARRIKPLPPSLPLSLRIFRTAAACDTPQ